MSFGSAGYTDTFSGDFSSFLASKLKKGLSDSLKKKTKAKRRKIKSKKLLGRKKKEKDDVKKAGQVKDAVKPAETTAGLDQKLLPPAEEETKELKEESEQEVEQEAVQAIEGKGIFDDLIKSIEGLRAANASIRGRLLELLKAKDNQTSALAVVAKKQYDDEVIDVEFVVIEQKRLKQAQEDETVKAFGTSAIVKKDKDVKDKGIFGGIVAKISNLLGGMGGMVLKVFKNPLAIAGLIGGGLLLGDIFGNSARAADGSITIDGDNVTKLEGMFGEALGGDQTGVESGAADYGQGDFPDQEFPSTQVPDIASSNVPTPPAAAAPGRGSNRDLAALAAISALESGSAQGQADVAQSVYNRLGDKGLYGKSIFEVVTRDAQYQPAYQNPNASSGPGTKTSKEFKSIRDEATAVAAMQSYYRKRGINKSTEAVTQEYRSALANISNPQLQARARQHVGGRTEFLGSGSRLHRLDKPVERWRGGRSDNRFFAAYGSQTQLQRGAVAPPAGLFTGTGSYAPPSPTSLETLADRTPGDSRPNIIFIPNTSVGIPVPSARSVMQGAQQLIEDPLESLKQLRLWGGR